VNQPIDTAALPANLFTWTGKTGVAEASDLGCQSRLPAMLPTAIRLDSRTGRSKLFHLVTPAYNDEDELVAWIYQSADHFDIHILND
jgi:hypothetical protein